MKHPFELASQVTEWLETTHHLDGRLVWYEAFAQKSLVYQELFRKLVSISTAGSINVERAAKPLKNNVLTKLRNSMGHKAAEICLRAGMNLRLMHAQKTGLKADALVDEWDSDDEGG